MGEALIKGLQASKHAEDSVSGDTRSKESAAEGEAPNG